MQLMTFNEAATQLPNLIAAAVRGEEILIAGNSEEVVKLVPIANGKKKRKFGSAKGTFQMANDFDEPLEDFKEYIE
ncbi:MAG TPA: DUF2281 domain-containing protein [Blastocatellia bacterium]|nr:DUF2281 domain-containing protein [Blastocatellia bacterium]HMV85026.1 DUF2281 domain-containing protein [Blastocatellia bacterium]HMX27901.1 DUF2281 domain-containing protein [Blastocatellia bacterium]HMY73587.1 DUF2281 domain-containing protein [Blastocatellia bacterium]HMZ22635.1 DUF2281 domain-containing protein [Blastocatellia bacterium]